MKKTLLKLSLFPLLCVGAGFSSVSSLSQNQIKPVYASTEIVPFADYEFNDTSKPGKDSSGNGFDLEMAGNHAGSICAVQTESGSGIQHLNVYNPATGTQGTRYTTADDGNNLYAPQLGSSGYDFSDMITGSYTISFKAKFDPISMKNPGNYLASFGLYEDCLTIVPYSRYFGSVGKWLTVLEIQFHNSGREGLTHNSETTTSDTGRKMDGLVCYYVIWDLHNEGDTVPTSVQSFVDSWNTYTLVGDAINDKAYLYVNGVKVPLKNTKLNETYTDGVSVPNGIKLTDLTGKTGRSYAFSLGAQMTINKGSGRQYGCFQADYFKIYNCAMSQENVSSLHSSGKAYYDNEANSRYISSMSLDKLPSLDITDTNSVSALIAGGKLPKVVKATLNDNSVVDMPVFWYDDPDDAVNKIYAIPSIGKKHHVKDTDEPDFDSIAGIFNPSFKKYSLDYNYVVDLTYDTSDFSVSNLKISNTSVALSDLPYQIDYQKGNSTLVTFDVTLLRNHASLEKVMYDGINRISDATVDNTKTHYSCKVYVTKGANIQLVLGIETGKITYRDKDGKTYGYSTYTYGGDEDLLNPEVINLQLDGAYADGYYLDTGFQNKFIKSDLNYLNPIDFVLYVKTSPLRESYTVSTDFSPVGGTVTGLKENGYYHKDDGADPFIAKITVTPQAGYMIDSISWNSENIPLVDDPDTLEKEGAKTFIYFEHSITTDSTLKVSFRQLNSYYIDIQSTEGGEIRRLNYDAQGLPLDDGSFEDPYLEGEEVHIDVAPSDGYTIESIEWNGVNIPLTTEQKSSGYSIGDEELIYASQNYPLIVVFAAPKTYKVNTNYNHENGSITGIETEYHFNDYTNIKIKANSGYHIASIQWNKESITVSDDEEMVINRPIEDNVTLTVNFALDVYYNVISYINGEGTIIGLSAQYKEGANLEGVTVTAAQGYYISQIIWGYSTVTITDNHSMDLSDCVVTSSSYRLTVTFAENPKKNVYISKTGKGTITGETVYEQDEDTATFTITPDVGYSIESIKWNGDNVTDALNDGVLQVSISSDSFLVVKFKKESSGGESTKDVTYSVSDDSEQHLGHSVYGLEANAVFVQGQDYNLYVVNKDGYRVTGVNIVEGSGFVTTTIENGVYQIHIAGISGNVSFTVTTVLEKEFAASITSDGIATVEGIVDGDRYASGETLELLFSVPVGHTINSISINGNNITVPVNIANYSYTLVVNGNININVLSKDAVSKVQLSSQVGSEGVISGINTTGYYPGEYAVLHVTSNEGYEILAVSFNGQDVEVTDLYSFTFSGLINGDNNIVIVSFKEKTGVTISYMSNNNSGGTHSELDIYDIGDETSIEIRANNDFYIADVIWNDEHITVNNNKLVTITQVIVQNNNSINVVFARINTFAITVVNNDDIGVVSGVKTSYEQGETTNINIVANSGYVISFVSFNGNVINVNNAETYKLKETVIADSQLVVSYKMKSNNYANLSLVVTEGGEVEDLESGSVLDGSELSFVVYADKDHYIKTIIINDEEIEITNTKEFEVYFEVDGDTNIDIIFGLSSEKAVGGCANSITGSAVACGLVFTTLVGVLVIRKKKEK